MLVQYLSHSQAYRLAETALVFSGVAGTKGDIPGRETDGRHWQQRRSGLRSELVLQRQALARILHHLLAPPVLPPLLQGCPWLCTHPLSSLQVATQNSPCCRANSVMPSMWQEVSSRAHKLQNQQTLTCVVIFTPDESHLNMVNCVI